MTEMMDPAPAYLLLFVLLILAGLGIGYSAEGSIGMLGNVIFAGFLGFVSGLYTAREETDVFGSLLITGGFTALVAWFLPLTVTWSIAIFLVGFVIGMRAETR